MRTSRSGGPGGQHANTSDTRVEATWDATSSDALTEQQRERVIARLGPTVRAVAEDTRSQSRNRELAVARLQAKVAERARRGPTLVDLRVHRGQQSSAGLPGSVVNRSVSNSAGCGPTATTSRNRA